jgi:beta-phosphoglucomutase-like phosphatase (HAD superfamily)
LLLLDAPDERAVEAYREIVGSARDVASKHIMDSLGLERALRALMPAYKASSPEQVLTELRVTIYNRSVADPAVIRANEWPHTTALLRTAKDTFCATAVATMSQRKEVDHVLTSLDLLEHLDVILTKEDVTNAKPDPEIYLLAAKRLDVPPSECLVLEDSVACVRAGVSAGMHVIAVATPFTECSLHRELPVPLEWVVRDPATLPEVVRRKIDEHDAISHAVKEPR